MKVIGAGLPRTGTMSMQAALNQLGFHCYHMQNVLKEKGHIKMWKNYISGENEMNWKELFKAYQATVDAPACFFYEELLHEFPDAKVILTVRDPDRWRKSFNVLMKTITAFRPISYLVPVLRNFFNMAFTLLEKHMPFSEIEKDHRQFIENHNDQVKKIVPKEKLLVYRVQDGWEPLCAFLNCEVPEGLPFPHLNEGGGTVKKVILREMFSKKVMFGLIATVTLVTAGSLIDIYF